MKKLVPFALFATVVAILLFVLTSCTPSSTSTADQMEREATEKLAAEGARQVGLPNIVNFTMKRQVKEIYEVLDREDIPTWTYIVSMNGDLILLCRSMGYGVPYGTQLTNPMKPEFVRYTGGFEFAVMPQPEPDGLFLPEGSHATWVMAIDPQGTRRIVCVEPDIIVSPFPLK